ncbi:TetR/AcrR family transcriptional regulator [Actinospica sp.]|uniref:TetR/AcrR family transcriptional regulator n=1 Tax=Actinospica sp. TaxID=1872142 RepID=UPI002B90C24F|nr:TetR/AcrR family transcriptional regulator [Actinospica sp.]HWG27211.1 TetR/AcrR family transcriptional regulator [Actinospica sp.]
MTNERARQLSTAEARRETVLRTAIGTFAARGYFGTTTTEVAKEAGISQAYVYRLFPNKESLFVAVVERCFVQVRGCLEQAVADADGGSADVVLAAMGDAYAKLITDRDLVLIQLHAQAAAVSESAVRDAVRRGYAHVVEYVRGASGGDEHEIQNFFARGMLCHLVVSIGADEVDAPWARTLTVDITHY